MHLLASINPAYSLAGFLVGALVGLTGNVLRPVLASTLAVMGGELMMF